MKKWETVDPQRQELINGVQRPWVRHKKCKHHSKTSPLLPCQLTIFFNRKPGATKEGGQQQPTGGQQQKQPPYQPTNSTRERAEGVKAYIESKYAK